MKRYFLLVLLSLFCFNLNANSTVDPLICRLQDGKECSDPKVFSKTIKKGCGGVESECRLVYCRSYCLKKNRPAKKRRCHTYCHHSKVQERFTPEEREL